MCVVSLSEQGGYVSQFCVVVAGMCHEFVFILCSQVALHEHCIIVVSVLVAIHLNPGILRVSQQ